MGFYAYKGNYNLGSEPLGTFDRLIRKDIKTVNGIKKICKRVFGDVYRVYFFTNFYDNSTFKEV